MAIKLEEHVIFIDRLQMDMVPLSVAKKAIEEAVASTEVKIEEAMSLIQKSLSEINNAVNDND